MSREYRLYLDDIETSAVKILQYTRGLSLDSFSKDSKTFDAVVLNLQIIGEAAKNVTETVQTKYPEADWRRIAGLRDVIAHGYFGPNEHVLWDLVENGVPELLLQIKKILASEG
jgi:uncharacterized protein with HEPN domain